MEQKQSCLNRTFYGIETKIRQNQRRARRVLIVPFMELKLISRFWCAGLVGS